MVCNFYSTDIITKQWKGNINLILVVQSNINIIH